MAKLKIGLLGCGGFMRLHAQRLNDHPDAAITALCDVTEEQVKGFIERAMADYSPAPEIYTDPADMYAKAGLDAVIIATPHTMHYEHCVQALDAGCHVYVEKPMVTSIHDAYALAEKTKASGKILVVGYNSPCSPNMIYLRDAIRKGTYGKLELVTCYVCQNWLKATTGKWRQDPKLSGGGQAFDSGAHMLNALCWCVESDIARVFAFIDNHGTQVDINSVAAVQFENGVMASIMVSGNCVNGHNAMTMIFEDARVDIEACGWFGTNIQVYEKGREPLEDLPITPDMGSPSPTHNFIDAVLGRAEPRTSPTNGIVQCQLMDCFYESGRTGKAISPADL